MEAKSDEWSGLGGGGLKEPSPWILHLVESLWCCLQDGAYIMVCVAAGDL